MSPKTLSYLALDTDRDEFCVGLKLGRQAEEYSKLSSKEQAFLKDGINVDTLYEHMFHMDFLAFIGNPST